MPGTRQDVTAVPLGEHVGFDHRLGQLLDEQRHAVGLDQELLDNLLRQLPRAGNALEIYCTGLGVPPAAPVVFIGPVPVQPFYAGPAPGLPGVNQVNIRIPAGVTGPQTLMFSVNSVHSNSIDITVQ